MCSANIIKHLIRNSLDLTIPFSATHVLIFHYGAAFWLCFVTGKQMSIFLALNCRPGNREIIFNYTLLPGGLLTKVVFRHALKIPDC